MSAVYEYLYPGQPIPAHLRRECKQGTPAQSAARVAHASQPRYQCVTPSGQERLRSEQVIPLHARMVR